MPKRESAAGQKGRADRHTAKSIAQGKANLAKGRAATAAKREAAKAEGLPTAGERWAQLLDGTLSVRDLSDKEIKLGRVRNADGGFAGKARSLPSHIAKAFSDERLRRANEGIARLLPLAVRTYAELMEDPDVSPADRQRIAKDVIERNLGKTPDRVQLGADDPFAAALSKVLLDRGDLADLAGEGLDLDADA